MGLLVNGQWQDKWYDTKESKGKRKMAQQGFLEKQDFRQKQGVTISMFPTLAPGHTEH